MIKNFILAFVSIFFFLGIVEVTLRIVNYIPDVPVPPNMYSNHEKTWWTLRPNFKGTMETADGKIQYIINPQGIRASQDLVKKPKGSGRIFLLGDSYTFGIGVNEEDTFSYILGNTFNDYEFVNLGVPGFGTMHSYYRMVDIAQKIGYPDKIIYIFCPNDPVDNISGKKIVVNGIRIDETRNFKPILAVLGWLYFKSKGLAFVLDKAYSFAFNPRYQLEKKLNKSTDVIKGRKDFLETKKYILKMATWAKFREIKFYFATTKESEFSEELIHLSTENGIPFFPENNMFKNLGKNNISVYLREGHWNATGHGYFAKLIENPFM